jgi:predicted dehydrogenase
MLGYATGLKSRLSGANSLWPKRWSRRSHLTFFGEKGASDMSEFSRRQFMTDSLLAAAAAATAGSVGSVGNLWAAESTATSAKGPNEKLSFAVIGVNGQGNGHLGNLVKKQEEVDIAIICDVDEEIGNKRCDETAAKQNGRRPKYVKDLRQVFDDKSIDCISAAVPNHWHALLSIWAMQAGKDVYIEKPASHNVSEGRRMVEAARKYNRICQLGTQCRSNGANMKAVEMIKAGKIGEVKLARGLCYKGRGSIGPKGEYDVPSYIDYNIWCGPAPLWTKSPYKGPKVTPHYDWHWVWNTGNGDIGNQGIHQMDIARWGLLVDGQPQGVVAYGGRFGYEDAGETPNTQVVVVDYGPKTLVFETRGLKTPKLKDAGVGVIWEGTDGYIVMTGYSDGALCDKDGKVIEAIKGGGDHHANFIKAVRSRKKDDLNADIEVGHLSTTPCHLGNISYRLGKTMPTSEVLDRLKSVKMSDNAQETLDRTVDHLTQNKVKLEGKTLFQCGEYLKFDPKSEKFVGNDKANEMLTREYRAPFVVPAEGKV